MRQRCALTFRGPRCLLPLLENLQAHGNVQKLLIAISVPHEELLVLVDLLAALGARLAGADVEGDLIGLAGGPDDVEVVAGRAVDRGLGLHLEFVDHPESVDGAGEVLVRVQRLARAERQRRAGGDNDRAN